MADEIAVVDAVEGEAEDPQDVALRAREQQFKDTYLNPERIDAQLPDHRKAPTRREALDALDTLRDFVLMKGMSDPELRSQINSILEETSFRLRAYVVGLAKVKVESLTALLQDIGNVENEISSRRFDFMNNQQLIAFYMALTSREKVLVDQILEVMKMPLPEKYEPKGGIEEVIDRLKNRGIDVSEISIESRKKVLSLVKAVTTSAIDESKSKSKTKTKKKKR